VLLRQRCVTGWRARGYGFGMSTKANMKQFLREIEPVRRQLEDWRRTRTKQRARIPQAVWEAMTPVARTHGVNRVCRALRIDYYSLKRRVESTAPTSPKFVEVISPIGSASTGEVVEVEDRRGRKMTLRLSPDNRADALALIQLFWRQA